MIDDKEHFYHDFPPMPNLTILPWLAWGVILGLVIAATFYASRVYADPRFMTTDGNGVVVTLHDTPCELKEVANLQYKATWQEGNKTFQGCWGPRPDVQAVVAFFDDKTVAVIPFGMLKKVTGA